MIIRDIEELGTVVLGNYKLESISEAREPRDARRYRVSVLHGLG